MTTYHFAREWPVGTTHHLHPHLRWYRSVLPFANSVAVRCSLYADEGSVEGQAARLENPEPNPKWEDGRRIATKDDAQFEPIGLALAAAAQDEEVPHLPKGRSRELLEAALARGRRYVGAVPTNGRRVPVVLAVVKAGPGGYELAAAPVGGAALPPGVGPVVAGRLTSALFGRDRRPGYALSGPDWADWAIWVDQSGELKLRIGTPEQELSAAITLYRIE
ncbi:MAG: hypothetical protein K2X87_27965 [Gemmataceae bacterium]|nr:hypothetical protein [Gemmataceae bacterium]